MKTFTYLARLAFSHELASRSSIVARGSLFAVIMVVFSRLWRVAYAGSPAAAQDPDAMTWYMAATEWIVLSIPATHLEIERDVRTGEIACQLARPTSYLTLTTARSMGASLAHLLSLAPIGFTLTAWFTESLPPAGWLSLALVPLAILSISLATLFTVAIGLSAFWLQESGPIFWVWQKLLFILGGLILPLSFYPDWMRLAAEKTPFAAMVGGPASMMLTGDTATALLAGAKLAGWGLVTVVVLKLVFSRAERMIDVNGG